jgi:uncharacterized protein
MLKSLSMKKYMVLVISLLVFSNIIIAQMDDKFYFPGKIYESMDSLKYEEVFLYTDTVRLSGIFLKPAIKPKATILFLHGDSGNVTKYLFMVRPLVNDGFQVFMIDFRGYGKSTGTPTHLNIAQDGQFVLDYLLKRQDVMNTKVMIYGASIGSQEAVHLTKNNQNKISALVLDGTISSFTDIAVNHSPAAQEKMIRQYLVSPYSAKEDIKSIKDIPKLFIHSRQDEQIPFAEGESVYKNARNPKTFFTYNGGHLQAMKVNPAGVIKAINKLIN